MATDRGMLGNIGSVLTQLDGGNGATANTGAQAMGTAQPHQGGGLQNMIVSEVASHIPAGMLGHSNAAGGGGMGAQLGNLMGGTNAGGNPVNGFIQQQVYNQMEDRIEGMLPGDYGQRVENFLHPQQGGALPSGGVPATGIPQQAGSVAPMTGTEGHHGGGVLGAIKKILH